MKILWPIIFLLISCSHQPAKNNERAPSSSFFNPFPQITAWPYQAEGCMSFRDQFLSETNMSSRITYSKNEYNRDCHVLSGRWIDSFTGELITNANDIIISPVIPIEHLWHKNYHRSWPLSRVRAFHHDREHILTFKRDGLGYQQFLENIKNLNRTPDDEQLTCEFVGTWVASKERWDIRTLASERRRISGHIEKCANNYDRSLYRHWSVVFGRTCNTRHESLVDNGQDIITENSNNLCSRILSGNWRDAYTNRIFTNPGDLDIDHFVPLKNAHESGAWSWPRWKKELYANDLKDPNHAIPVHNSENRKKADRDPSNYMPPFTPYHCNYIKYWIAIKMRWDLNYTSEEFEFITNSYNQCKEQFPKDPAFHNEDLLKILQLRVQ